MKIRRCISRVTVKNVGNVFGDTVYYPTLTYSLQSKYIDDMCRVYTLRGVVFTFVDAIIMHLCVYMCARFTDNLDVVQTALM